MPMGMMGNKSFAQVLLGKGGKPMMGQEPDEVNKDQSAIDASKELIKAVKSEDPERVFRAFKVIMEHCKDSEESEESSESESFKESY